MFIAQYPVRTNLAATSADDVVPVAVLAPSTDVNSQMDGSSGMATESSATAAPFHTFPHHYKPVMQPYLDRCAETPEQQQVIEIFLRHIQHNTGAGLPDPEIIRRFAPAPPMYYAMMGEGGTGKSHVINAIADYMINNDCGDRLVRLAFTGNAAGNIGGQTIHSAMALSIKNCGGGGGSGDGTTEFSGTSAQINTKLKNHMLSDQWRKIKYLIIDEISMVSLQLFEDMMAATKARNFDAELRRPFDGMTVLFVGDFYQLDPVNGVALYHTDNPKFTSAAHFWRTGITHTTILTKNHRAASDEWLRGLLRRMRDRLVTIDDYNRLRTFHIDHVNDSQQPKINLASPEWLTATYITNLNDTRLAINKLIAHRHAAHLNERITICPSVDTVRDRGNSDSRLHQTNNASCALRTTKLKNMPLERVLYLHRGQHVIVTSNIAVSFQITNGTPGTIVDIVPIDGSVIETPNYTILMQPPIIVFQPLSATSALATPTFKKTMDLGRAHCATLSAHQMTIPIPSVKQAFKVPRATFGDHLLYREQLGITGASCVTPFKAQGRTYDRIVADLCKPNYHVSSNTPYVILSRVRSTAGLLIMDMDDDPHKFLSYVNAAVHPKLVCMLASLQQWDRDTSARFRDGKWY
jgi:hypothetical protein